MAEKTCEVCGSETRWIDDLGFRGGIGCPVCHNAKKALSQCEQDASDVMDWVKALVAHAVANVSVKARHYGEDP